MESDNLSRVVWITGYSGSGKTTVARKVEASLREQGVSTISLDGDDLRAIFSGKWGYEYPIPHPKVNCYTVSDATGWQ